MVDLPLKGDTRTDFSQKLVVKEVPVSKYPSCAATKRKDITDQDDTVADFILGLVDQAVNLPVNTGNPPVHENNQHKRAKTAHDPEDQALAKFDPPKSGKVPIIDMVLRWVNNNQKEYKV